MKGDSPFDSRRDTPYAQGERMSMVKLRHYDEPWSVGRDCLRGKKMAAARPHISVGHSGRMPARLTTSAHCAISARIFVPNCPDVFPTGSSPRLVSCWRTSAD